jgi:hypothetical protein
MFQYMVALRIKDLVPDLEIVGYDMPEWQLSSITADPVPRVAPRINQHVLPMVEIAAQLRAHRVPVVVSYALGCRLDTLRPVEGYRSTFLPPTDLTIPEFGDDHIVINIRAEDILREPHADYRPIPLSFISQVVEASGRHPVFVGQLADDPYSVAIRRRFPSATVLPTRGALADFETLRRAKHLVIPISTFAWLASWLSDATSIHLPVSGLYHPRRRPDVDLLPTNDSRYVFYECDAAPWGATTEELDALLADEEHAVLQRDQVDEWRSQAAEVVRPILEEKRRHFLRACRRTRLHLSVDRWTGWLRSGARR